MMIRLYLLMATIISVVSCNTKQKSLETTPQVADETKVILSAEERRLAGIELGTVERGELNQYIKLNGMMEAPPQRLISISFPMPGYLQKTSLLPGMKVTKGQPIAEMRDLGIVQLQQDYLMAKARVAYLQKEYERQRLLNENKTTSDKVFEQTRAEFEAQKILMNGLQQKLRMINIDPSSLSETNMRNGANIYSPINGYVSAVHVNIGKFITAGETMFELVDPTDPHLTLKAFEKDLPRIQRGQKIKMTLVNKPGISYSGEVILVGKNILPDRSAEVHCHVDGATDGLLPGMFVTAEVELKTKTGNIVPEEAVVRFGDTQFVFVQLTDSSFRMQPVKAGLTEHHKTEIIEPADIDQKTLILKNAYTALMKLKNTTE